jgi:hypothetical protein
MPENPKRHENEIDADDLIRQYEETATGEETESDEGQETLPWHDQASQDTPMPADAVLTAGDIDAAWDQAAVGDETVGGSTPTPDQDIVDEIGRALGVNYEDGEPLHTTEKIERRDQDRWELHPASSEDFAERRHLPDAPAGSEEPRSKRTPSAQDDKTRKAA